MSCGATCNGRAFSGVLTELPSQVIVVHSSVVINRPGLFESVPHMNERNPSKPLVHWDTKLDPVIFSQRFRGNLLQGQQKTVERAPNRSPNGCEAACVAVLCSGTYTAFGGFTADARPSHVIAVQLSQPLSAVQLATWKSPVVPSHTYVTVLSSLALSKPVWHAKVKVEPGSWSLVCSAVPVG